MIGPDMPLVTTLDLHGNGIGNEGGIAFAAALSTNTSLRTLILSFNRLGPQAGHALGEMLRTNQGLATLDLMGNELMKSVLVLQEVARQAVEQRGTLLRVVV